MSTKGLGGAGTEAIRGLRTQQVSSSHTLVTPTFPMRTLELLESQGGTESPDLAGHRLETGHVRMQSRIGTRGGSRHAGTASWPVLDTGQTPPHPQVASHPCTHHHQRWHPRKPQVHSQSASTKWGLSSKEAECDLEGTIV